MHINVLFCLSDFLWIGSPESGVDSYVKKGGMAGSYLYKSEEDARKYVTIE